MATAARRSRRRRIATPSVAAAFAEHNLLTYAAAIAFQALIALVPMTALGLGILGAAGEQTVWTNHLAPVIRGRVTVPVFRAIDSTVERVLRHGTGGLIAVSALLAIWYLTAALRPVIEALNQIHDVHDDRAWWHRLGVAVGLGAAAGVALYGSAVLVIGGPRGLPLGFLRWGGAIVLLMLLVGLLVRFAPAQRPKASWASLGAVLVVSSWIVASLAFRVFVTDVADFKTPIGGLTVLLVLTSYLFVSAIVFLVGIQLDELLRKRDPDASSVFHHARRALRR